MLMAVMILAAVAGFVLLTRWDKADGRTNEYRLTEYTDMRSLRRNMPHSQGIAAAEIYADRQSQRLGETKTRRCETAQICAEAHWRKLKACC